MKQLRVGLRRSVRNVGRMFFRFGFRDTGKVGKPSAGSIRESDFTEPVRGSGSAWASESAMEDSRSGMHSRSEIAFPSSEAPVLVGTDPRFKNPELSFET